MIIHIDQVFFTEIFIRLLYFLNKKKKRSNARVHLSRQSNEIKYQFKKDERSREPIGKKKKIKKIEKYRDCKEKLRGKTTSTILGIFFRFSGKFYLHVYNITKFISLKYYSFLII